jgi:hypothetical protein
MAAEVLLESMPSDTMQAAAEVPRVAQALGASVFLPAAEASVVAEERAAP